MEYVAQLTRQSNGHVPSLREAVLDTWGTSLDEVSAKAGEPVTVTADLPDGLTGRGIMEAAHQQCVDLLAPVIACHHGGCFDANKARDLAVQMSLEQLGAERGDVVETLTWVITDLMPVLDSIAMARQHGEVEGGFKLVVDELEKVANTHGLSSFGEVGDAFDPNLHEALMQMPMEGATVTSVSQVMQPGYKLGDRVLRPARVAVSDPDPNTKPGESKAEGSGEQAPEADSD